LFDFAYLFLILIIFLQSIVVYLDNQCNMFSFFNNASIGNVAKAYTHRGQVLTIARSIFFIVPPLLGYLIINFELDAIKKLIVIVAIINFIITLAQNLTYIKIKKITIFQILKSFDSFKFSLSFHLGWIAFFFFLVTPYLTNLLALLFPNDGLWIVQLNPLFNSFLTFYVIWVFEPKVAKKLDNKKSFIIEFLEANLSRLFGRFLFLFFCLLFYSFV